MTQSEFLNPIVAAAKENFPAYWSRLADHERLRVAALEQINKEVIQGFAEALWQLCTQQMEQEAERVAKTCPCCGRACERRKTQQRVRMNLLGLVVMVLCVYYYCRGCHRGDSPVRRWLGVEDGSVSLRLERATTDLSSRLTFGDTVKTLHEQHGQEMDRTKAERITYRVGQDALLYLRERRDKALGQFSQEGRQEGVSQLQLVADGGAVPVGTLTRPRGTEVTEETPRTPVRNLPKGQRTIQGREARFIAVREPQTKTERIVDCHIAPYKQPEFSGQRMLTCAIEAGLGDNTQIHGVFDMGTWIHPQFELQFAHVAKSAVADIMHVTQYLTDAGRVLVGEKGAHPYGQAQKQRMLSGKVDEVLAELKEHCCTSSCQKDEHGVCLVRAAIRYMDNHRRYLNYPPILAQNLPVGSGEAESGIRHQIKKRADVAGAWTESHVQLILALITIRESGWWDDFWRWCDERDLEQWHQRQRGETRPCFRGNRKRQAAAVQLAN